MCENLGTDGKVNVKSVGDKVLALTRTGREGRMTPKGGGVDIGLLKRG